MLVFVAGQAPPMDLKVLILVLSLILALESLQVLHMLLLDPQLEVLQLDNLRLIVVDGLRHAVLLTLDHEQLHLDRLLNI